MNIEIIKQAILELVEKYSLTKVTLFGSQADGTAGPLSDVDLMVEFIGPVSLITLGLLKEELEEKLHISVDIIHGPLRPGDILEIHHSIVLYEK